MATLLAKLSKQQTILEKQRTALAAAKENTPHPEHDDSPSGSILLTPVTDASHESGEKDHADDEKTAKIEPIEVMRLKKELDVAKDKLLRQAQELTQNRALQQAFVPGKDSSFATTVSSKSMFVDRTCGGTQDASCTTSYGATARQEIHGPQDDGRSDSSDPLSAASFSRPLNIWSPNAGPAFQEGLLPTNVWNQAAGRGWVGRPMPSNLPPLMVPPPQQMQHRIFSGPGSLSAGPARFPTDFNQYAVGNGLRRANTQGNRSGSALPHYRSQGWESYGGNSDPSPTSINPALPFQPMSVFQAAASYQPRPIGTPLSPTAAEFTTGNITGNPWNPVVSLLSMAMCYYGLQLSRHRLAHLQDKLMCLHWSLSTTAVCLTVA